MPNNSAVLHFLKGCVGATTVTLSDELNIIIYWHTPYDQNLFENSFAVGYYRGKLITVDCLLEKIYCLPNSIPEGLNFEKKLAKDGPLSVHIDGKFLSMVIYTFN